MTQSNTVQIAGNIPEHGQKRTFSEFGFHINVIWTPIFSCSDGTWWY